MSDEKEMVVIFRKFPEGDVIALFPESPGDFDVATCCSYMHVGQHASADYRLVVERTELALPDEYELLKKELEADPYEYNLRVLKRASMKHHNVRRLEILKMME